MTQISPSNAAQLKHLQAQLNRDREALVGAKLAMKKAAREVEEITTRIRQNEQTLCDLRTSNSAAIVSEHAILRYLERVMGVDIAELSEKVFPKEMAGAVKM